MNEFPETMMSPRRLDRRAMLRNSLIGGPALFAASRVQADQKPDANQQIAVGVIGAGIRGKHLIRDMPDDARIVAVCDCYAPRIDEVRH